MATQMSAAKLGQVTGEMRAVARAEGVPLRKIREGVAQGTIVIAYSPRRRGARPLGIGEGLRTKVNANLGTSPDLCDPDLEVEKARVAVRCGADTLMDLSTGGDLDGVRRRILEAADVPLGTVPVYQAAVEAARSRGSIVDMTEDDLFGTIEKHARDGVAFMTLHCGVTRRIVQRIAEHPRLSGIVSRGGTFHAAWILRHGRENPLHEDYDHLLDLAREYDFTLSLGDGLRPGSIFDSTDWPQVQELLTLGDLVERARAAGVQAMVEGPGHLPLDHIRPNVQLEKSTCHGAPFYVLGPIPTEVAPGYDHITGAIGGALAGLAGADFLCYVTPAEHLGLPTPQDVKEGVIATRIAAHIVDIVKLGPRAAARDLEMAKARAGLDWKGQLRAALDPERAKDYRGRTRLRSPEACSMCSEYCAIKLFREALKAEGQCL